MSLNEDQKQRVKTAFLSYAQGQKTVSEAMVDQLICGAVPGCSWEELQERKSVRPVDPAVGYELPDFFALVHSDPKYITFICQYFPAAPPKQKEPEIDALELKTQKGF